MKENIENRCIYLWMPYHYEALCGRDLPAGLHHLWMHKLPVALLDRGFSPSSPRAKASIRHRPPCQASGALHCKSTSALHEHADTRWPTS